MVEKKNCNSMFFALSFVCFYSLILLKKQKGKKEKEKRKKSSFCHCFAALVRWSTELGSSMPTQTAPPAADQQLKLCQKFIFGPFCECLSFSF
jgi:hypothetical protein